MKTQIYLTAALLAAGTLAHADQFYDQTAWANAELAANPAVQFANVDLTNIISRDNGITTTFGNGIAISDFVMANDLIQPGQWSIEAQTWKDNFAQNESWQIRMAGMDVVGFAGTLNMPSVSAGLFIYGGDHGGYNVPTNSSVASVNMFYGITFDELANGIARIAPGDINANQQYFEMSDMELAILPTPVPIDPVPEPTTCGLIAIGGLAIVSSKWYRAKN